MRCSVRLGIVPHRRMAATRMHNALLMWHGKASSMAMVRRKAERLRAAGDDVRMAQSLYMWRDHVDSEKRSRELLQQARAELAVRRQSQVCSAPADLC